jgi:hypothetical protein
MQIFKEYIWFIAMPPTFRETASPCKEGEQGTWVGQSNIMLEQVVWVSDTFSVRISQEFPTEL